MQPAMCDWTHMPLDVLYVIATHTPIRSVLGAMRGTCRRWYAFLSGDLFCRWALAHRLYNAKCPVDRTVAAVPDDGDMTRPRKRTRKYALARSALLVPALRLVRRACVHCGLTIETRIHPVQEVRVCGNCSTLDPYHIVSQRTATDMGLSAMDLRFTKHVMTFAGKMFSYADLKRLLCDKYQGLPLQRIDSATRAMYSCARNEALRSVFQCVQAEVNATLREAEMTALEVEQYWLSDQGQHVMVIQGDHHAKQMRCVTHPDAIVQSAIEFTLRERLARAIQYVARDAARAP